MRLVAETMQVLQEILETLASEAYAFLPWPEKPRQAQSLQILKAKRGSPGKYLDWRPSMNTRGIEAG